jgi:hypothetical protein
MREDMADKKLFDVYEKANIVSAKPINQKRPGVLTPGLSFRSIH